jgi:hypothetical protein
LRFISLSLRRTLSTPRAARFARAPWPLNDVIQQKDVDSDIIARQACEEKKLGFNSNKMG